MGLAAQPYDEPAILVSCTTTELKMADESAEVDERSEITLSDAEERSGTEG